MVRGHDDINRENGSLRADATWRRRSATLTALGISGKRRPAPTWLRSLRQVRGRLSSKRWPRTCRDDDACEDPPENSHGVSSAVAPIAPKAASGPGGNHADYACKRAAARASSKRSPSLR